MYQQLKALANFDASNLDELVALATFAAGMKATYSAYLMPVPEWLADKSRSIETEIRMKNRDRLEAELKKAKLEREGLATQAERRAASDQRIADLEHALKNA